MFRKILLSCLLFPVMPMLQADGASGGGAGGTDDKGSAGEDTGSGAEGSGEGSKKTEDEKLFSQTQLDDIIGRRLAKERKAWEKTMKDAEETAKLSEIEKLKKEKEDADKSKADIITKANQRLIKSEVIVKAVALKIVDPDAAYALMDKTDIEVSDDGEVVGIDDALKKLVKNKPYLIGEGIVTKTGDNQNDNKDKKPTGAMNDLIRKAAGH